MFISLLEPMSVGELGSNIFLFWADVRPRYGQIYVTERQRRSPLVTLSAFSLGA